MLENSFTAFFMLKVIPSNQHVRTVWGLFMSEHTRRCIQALVSPLRVEQIRLFACNHHMFEAFRRHCHLAISSLFQGRGFDSKWALLNSYDGSIHFGLRLTRFGNWSLCVLHACRLCRSLNNAGSHCGAWFGKLAPGLNSMVERCLLPKSICFSLSI